MTAYFVTATGTDVGKTFVTAGLVRLLRARGEAISVLKPVVSGISEDRLAESDPGVLLAALGQEVSAAAVAQISPWRFEAPLAPDLAAAREGRTVPFEELVAFCREHCARAHGTLLIEGVGGVLVPLDAHRTVRDWLSALAIPAIVVAGSYLGTISHTLTALEALRRSDIAIAALVISESPANGASLEDTIGTLARFEPDLPIVPIARAPTRTALSSDFAMLWDALAARG